MWPIIDRHDMLFLKECVQLRLNLLQINNLSIHRSASQSYKFHNSASLFGQTKLSSQEVIHVFFANFMTHVFTSFIFRFISRFQIFSERMSTLMTFKKRTMLLNAMTRISFLLTHQLKILISRADVFSQKVSVYTLP